jgi:hypothetical protein
MGASHFLQPAARPLGSAGTPSNPRARRAELRRS